jgi:endonuclease YncB( thermonuclease family)
MAEKLPHSLGVWWKAGVCGWSLTRQMRHGLTRTARNRDALAYVFLKDGILLNAEIIKQGYGFAYTRFPFARMEEFTHLERDAQEQLRRLWAFAMSRD